MTIKEGQVYEMPFTHYPFVVTFIDNDIFSVPSVDIIYEDGEMMYVIYVDGVEQKRYDSKLLCHIWIIMHGYVRDGYGEFGDSNRYFFIDDRVKIEVE